MTDIEKMREWIRTFPGEIPAEFRIDYTNEVPQNAGLFPAGIVEVSRRGYINGDLVVTNQYNFALYAIFVKPGDIDEISTLNAEWVMAFQQWVQEQSIRRQTPTFGDYNTDREVIKAQNGMYMMDNVSGETGTYIITITVQFQKHYKREDN